MRTPKEVPLHSQFNRGVLSLSVDIIPDATYRWQNCKAGTADWVNLEAYVQSTCSVLSSDYAEGDKYRCLILVRNRVVNYSSVLTISKDQSRGNFYSGVYSRSPQPSVADTDGMEGLAFEQYCADILRENGFRDVEVTPGSGDYGIDILCRKDMISYAIQCKCYSGTIGNKAVQEALSGKVFYGCTVGVVLTNNYFTREAIETADKTNVLLWDRDDLDHMIRHPGTPYQTKQEQRMRERRRQRQQNKSQGMPDWEKDVRRQEREWQRQQHQERDQRERDQYREAQQEAERERRYREQQKQKEQKYFEGCSTMDEAKKRFHELMSKYHPDVPVTGDPEIAKEINRQFVEFKKIFGN